ncbi:MAG: MFS transporter, partial [Nocardioides sp.]
RPSGSVWSAWREPRTLLIGLMMLSLALTEGTANDWLAVALIDGYDLPHWAGVAGFGVFVTAMTTGRFVGPVILDRHGRAPVRWTTMAMAGVGVLLTVLAGTPALALVGVALWGLGASLGFPVGISAASDEPAHAPARVSVVTSIAYTAFLAGPPFLGFVAEHVGTLRALLVIALLLIPSALVVPAARQPHRASA